MLENYQYQVMEMQKSNLKSNLFLSISYVVRDPGIYLISLRFKLKVDTSGFKIRTHITETRSHLQVSLSFRKFESELAK